MLRIRTPLFALVLLLIATVPVRADKIDDYITSEMQRQHIPGTSIAVLKDGKIIKAEGYGLANVELNVPARPETVYKIGSVSKQLIATGINGDEMIIHEMIIKGGDNDKNPQKFRVTLYPNTNPRAVDLFPLRHNSMGSIIYGIYWLEGNALKFCWPATPGARERPKKFKSEQGSKIALFTLKRVKS